MVVKGAEFEGQTSLTFDKQQLHLHRLNGEEHDDWGKTQGEQELGVEQLREGLRQEGHLQAANFDYHMLLRFLRARDYEVDKATEMLIQHLQWRKEYGTDTIIEDFDFKERTQFLAVYPQGYHKTDKQGRPIYIQHLGSIDLKKITQVTTKERMTRFHVQEWERCLKTIFPACTQKAGHRIDQMFAIMDVSGVGLHMLSPDVRATLKEITKIDQDNYPETLGKVFIINAPFVFKAVWAFIQPLLNPRTRGKIELHGKNFLPSLLEHVDIDCIPQYLGGTSNKTLVDDVGPWNDFAQMTVNDTELVPLRLKSPRLGESGTFKRPESPVHDSVKEQDIIATSINIHDKHNDFDKGSDEGSGFYTPRQVSFSDDRQHKLSLQDSILIDGGDIELQLLDRLQTKPAIKQIKVPLVDRVRRLEEFLKPRATSSKMYVEDTNEGIPLINRVEHLEEACEVVLMAEESRLQQLEEERKQANKMHRGCCGCSIM
eukprot:TRINITY_DN10320_c0_g1_i1.p1 TRINITY_DN10320_c0_g1~~TRINITY_DN10320_c0_g1_i1.p1  ORF type:complete len:486 (+),score=63.15 TRINITY_DN10320_c0_g1_i1:80-1537(+)